MGKCIEEFSKDLVVLFQSLSGPPPFVLNIYNITQSKEKRRKIEEEEEDVG